MQLILLTRTMARPILALTATTTQTLLPRPPPMGFAYHPASSSVGPSLTFPASIGSSQISPALSSSQSSTSSSQSSTSSASSHSSHSSQSPTPHFQPSSYSYSATYPNTSGSLDSTSTTSAVASTNPGGHPQMYMSQQHQHPQAAAAYVASTSGAPLPTYDAFAHQHTNYPPYHSNSSSSTTAPTASIDLNRSPVSSLTYDPSNTLSQHPFDPNLTRHQQPYSGELKLTQPVYTTTAPSTTESFASGPYSTSSPITDLNNNNTHHNNQPDSAGGAPSFLASTPANPLTLPATAGPIGHHDNTSMFGAHQQQQQQQMAVVTSAGGSTIPAHSQPQHYTHQQPQHYQYYSQYSTTPSADSQRPQQAQPFMPYYSTPMSVPGLGAPMAPTLSLTVSAPGLVGVSSSGTNSSSSSPGSSHSHTKKHSSSRRKKGNSSATAGAAGASGSTAQAPRKRTTRACDQCNHLRTKCDGKQPCAHCIEFHLECQYLRVPLKRGKASITYIESQREKMRQQQLLAKQE